MSGATRCQHRILLTSRLDYHLPIQDAITARRILDGRFYAATLVAPGSRMFQLSYQCVHVEDHDGTHMDSSSYQWSSPEDIDRAEQEDPGSVPDREGLDPG